MKLASPDPALIFRSQPDRIALTAKGAPRQTTGHIMIGLAQHAADQPDATPETRALAQRLRARHPATSIGE